MGGPIGPWSYTFPQNDREIQGNNYLYSVNNTDCTGSGKEKY
jgi:hypothetical protein